MHCHVNRRLLLAAPTTRCLQSAMAELGSSQSLATRARVLFLALRAQSNPLPQTPSRCMHDIVIIRPRYPLQQQNIPVDPSNDVR